MPPFIPAETNIPGVWPQLNPLLSLCQLRLVPPAEPARGLKMASKSTFVVRWELWILHHAKNEILWFLNLSLCAGSLTGFPFCPPALPEPWGKLKLRICQSHSELRNMTQGRMQERCSLLCAQILYLHKPIHICISIFCRFIHKCYIVKSCSPASLLDRHSCTRVPIPGVLPAGSTGLMCCYPIISTFFPWLF